MQTRGAARRRSMRLLGAAPLTAVAALTAAFLSGAPALASPGQDGLDRIIADPPARIEVAFVLDTTGSMSGLIEGAKKKIWSIANNMMDLEPRPEVRFALIGYRDRGDTYVTKRFDLTEDVQSIYGELLAFRAGGGGDNPESVNQALAEAVTDLSWSQDRSVFRAVFLVGDAPPHMDYQDDTPYPITLETAEDKDILVNAIQAGGQRGTTRIWREIAQLGGGAYAQIAQDGAMAFVPSPYDAEIEKLNIELNDTVVPYGRAADQARVAENVGRAKGVAGSAAAEMNSYFAKQSVASARKVISGGGDLVEDVANGAVALDDVKQEKLPAEMRGLSAEEREAYVAERAAKRASVRASLDDLLAKRDAHVAETRAAAAETDAFDAEVDRMIRSQAAAKGFK